jgi:3-hydroxyacyl-CoA dehydrogenase
LFDEFGPAWFREQLVADSMKVPEVLVAIGDGKFYRVDAACIDDQGNDIEQFDSSSAAYVPVTRASGVLRVSDLKRTRQRLLGNDAASLWDIGDGVVCVEFHSKTNALLPQSMEALALGIDFATSKRRALLIHNDAPYFSVGFNLDFALACIKSKSWSALDEALRDFQSTCVACASCAIPVIAVPSGLGLGGGFEVLVHCDALQVHSNISLGLVEPMVGLIPSGGGCKQLLHRSTVQAGDADSTQQAAIDTFNLIGTSRTAVSPAQARPLRLMQAHDRVSMNRDRLLSDGKVFALELADNYAANAPPQFIALGEPGHVALETVLQDLLTQGIAQAHDVTVSRQLAHVLCGGDAARGTAVTEQAMLDLEHEAFITLAETNETRACIEHMLSTGRALRN